ncbi:MAG: hypothetical protein IKP40_10615 [Clostridia bacterium]|nr:hypothetical protein [Clostridia bacterium]
MPDTYEDIRSKERPVHEGDDFSRKHPPMARADRAKIFMPFAALRGFEDTLKAMQPKDEARDEAGTEREEAGDWAD